MKRLLTAGVGLALFLAMGIAGTAGFPWGIKP